MEHRHFKISSSQGHERKASWRFSVATCLVCMHGTAPRPREQCRFHWAESKGGRICISACEKQSHGPTVPLGNCHWQSQSTCLWMAKAIACGRDSCLKHGHQWWKYCSNARTVWPSTTRILEMQELTFLLGKTDKLGSTPSSGHSPDYMLPLGPNRPIRRVHCAGY